MKLLGKYIEENLQDTELDRVLRFDTKSKIHKRKISTVEKQIQLENKQKT